MMNVRRLITRPTTDVLRMYPPAICMGLMGVTFTSLSLPLALSSIIVCREPADVVTATIPSIPDRTHAST